MANTMAISSTDRGNKQFQGAFKEMFFATGSVTDQDAIADDVINRHKNKVNRRIMNFKVET